MTVEEVKDFVDRVPVVVSDLSFALDDGEFEELRMSSMQFFCQDMVTLHINDEKITVFRKIKR